MSCTRCSEPQSRAAGKPLCCKSRCASSSRVLLHAHQNGRAESTEANPVRQDFSFLFLHLNIVIQELIPPPSGKTWSRPSKGVGVVVQSLLEIFEGALFAHNLHSTQRDSQRQSESVCGRVGERVDDRVTSPELNHNFNSLQYGRGRTLTKN